jgi:hypothetical protein
MRQYLAPRAEGLSNVDGANDGARLVVDRLDRPRDGEGFRVPT